MSVIEGSVMKHTGDTVSIGTLLATFAGWLPHIASLLTIVWMAIRIYETETVKRIISKWRGRSL